MPEIEVDLGYEPRQQFIPFHVRSQRYAVIVAHRGAGKTVACVLDLIDAAAKKPNAKFAYIAPQLKQAKDVAWGYLKDHGLLIPGATVHENELRLNLTNGSVIRLYGAENPDSLRGNHLNGAVLDEYGDMHPQLYSAIIRPTLTNKKGWVTWIGTPKGPNTFFELWQAAQGDPNYFTLMLRASSAGILDPVELADARKHAGSPEQYAREYECSFAAPDVGVYYGREMAAAVDEGRITSKVYSHTHEVHTAWDLGANNMTAIWFFQKVGMQIWLVDYYATSMMGLDHYAKVLQDRGYKYGQHYLPHDVEQTHIGAGTIAHSRKTTLQNLGIPVSVIPKHAVEDGVNAVRKALPRCVFDKDKCAEGIKAMQLYHRQWDDQRKVFLEKHYKDWTTDAADAFRYMAMSLNDQPILSGKTSWLKKTKDRLGWIV